SRPISRSAMAFIDAGQFKRLANHHIGDCVALSAQAGWNQTIEDWLLFLRHGTILGLPGSNGVTVATGAVLPYSDRFAWISMVLDGLATARTDWHKYFERVLRRGCAAGLGIGARCHSGGRTHLPPARFRGDVQFIALARRHPNSLQSDLRHSRDGGRRYRLGGG